MSLTWDRHTHIWDDEMILRTMMLGDIPDYKKMIGEVSLLKLSDIYLRKSYELDRKSKVFWGHFFHSIPAKSGYYSSSPHDAPSRHIAS